MFAYGLLSVVLVLYLVEVGLKEWEVGLLLTLTLAGDTAISLCLTTTADRLGRRRTLIAGAILMVLAGIVFVSTGNMFVLLVAATIGVISPSGNEIGPFLSVEQAALSHIVSDEQRTDVFAWYNLVGSFSTALGALAGGCVRRRFRDSEHYRLLVPRPISTRPSDAWHDLLVRQSPGWRVRIGCWLVGSTHRAGEHDGLHASAIERAADPGSFDAQRVLGRGSALTTVQHFTDGCADPPGLYNGCCATG